MSEIIPITEILGLQEEPNVSNTEIADLVGVPRPEKDRKLIPANNLIRVRSGDGRLHVVSKGLLEQSPYFRALVNNHRLGELGFSVISISTREIEICCSSESFTNLLNVLRYGQESAFDLSNSAKFMLLSDANYFGFPAALFDRISSPLQITRPTPRLAPIKVKASLILPC